MPTPAPPETTPPVTIGTTATTTPPPVVAVTIDGDDTAGAVIAALYAWPADRSVTPDIPAGLLAALDPVVLSDDLDLTGAMRQAAISGGRVAVVTIDDDVILLADEGQGWRIVGARLERFGLPAWYGPPVRHVLVIGTDARPGQSPQAYRADSIHIVSSNREAAAGSIVGIPRDTLVATSYGQDKLTHVNAVSGTAEVSTVVAGLSGVPIEGYVLTGFIGFRHLINGIGGVVIDVPYAMAEEKSKAFLSKGIQRLWGPNALAFSRNRHIPGGDFTRSLHQGMVIAAAFDAVHEVDVGDLPDLLALLTSHAVTDLDPGDLLTLAATALDLERVSNVVLDGHVSTVDGASVVLLDDDANAPLLADLADGVIAAG